jgi:hypothetical protein
MLERLPERLQHDSVDEAGASSVEHRLKFSPLILTLSRSSPHLEGESPL